MRIVIEYYPEADDMIDVEASRPDWSESVPSIVQAEEAFGRLGRYINNQEHEHGLKN